MKLFFVENSKKAFTLIELLIVIAIIGILASVTLVSLNSGRAKARDAARLKEIKSIQTALELYFISNGRYPRSSFCGATRPNTSWCNSVESQDGLGHWLKDAGAGQLSDSEEPVDPKQGSTANWLPYGGGTYFYYSPGPWYMLVFGLEDTSHSLQQHDRAYTCGAGSYHYGNGSNGIITIGEVSGC